MERNALQQTTQHIDAFDVVVSKTTSQSICKRRSVANHLREVGEHSKAASKTRTFEPATSLRLLVRGQRERCQTSRHHRVQFGGMFTAHFGRGHD